MAFATQIKQLDTEVQRKIERGARLDPVPRVVIAETTAGRFYDQLGSYTMILFVSPTLRVVIEQTSGAHVQWIPTTVRGRPELRYDAVNVLDTIPALDLDRSKVTHLPGSTAIDRILSFRLRTLAADAPPIFHVAEAPTFVLVRDDLRAELETASDHPGRLTPAEKYRSGS
jgi:hypothetical protein